MKPLFSQLQGKFLHFYLVALLLVSFTLSPPELVPLTLFFLLHLHFSDFIAFRLLFQKISFSYPFPSFASPFHSGSKHSWHTWLHHSPRKGINQEWFPSVNLGIAKSEPRKCTRTQWIFEACVQFPVAVAWAWTTLSGVTKSYPSKAAGVASKSYSAMCPLSINIPWISLLAPLADWEPSKSVALFPWLDFQLRDNVSGRAQFIRQGPPAVAEGRDVLSRGQLLKIYVPG